MRPDVEQVTNFPIPQ